MRINKTTFAILFLNIIPFFIFKTAEKNLKGLTHDLRSKFYILIFMYTTAYLRILNVRSKVIKRYSGKSSLFCKPNSSLIFVYK